MSFDVKRYEKIAEIFELWWEHKLERPIIQVTLTPSAKSEGDFFASNYRRDILNACYDLELPAEEAAKQIDEAYERLTFLGDAFPVFYMRPTCVMGGFLGQEYTVNKEQGTVWFEKTGQELEEIAELTVDFENPLLKRALDLTRAVRDHFKGSLAMGVPDMGGVYDILSAMRDTNDLLMDLYDEEDEVKAAAWNLHEQFKKLYDSFMEILDLNQLPGYTCWATMLSQKPYFVLQNDFSAMIGPDMYDEFYLPILQKECEYIPRTIYHLDGPDAVRHLDSILTVKELDGVQWVNGAGSAPLNEWPEIYRKVIGAGKLFQIFINGSQELKYIDDIVNTVGTTKGLCFICTGTENEKEEFEKYLKKYSVE